MSTKVPKPQLDSRDGDMVAAESIQAFPAQLSARGHNNAGVAIAEAMAYIYDKLIYMFNQTPTAVLQQQLYLMGAPLRDATPATCTQQFTLSNPQPSDTVIEAGTVVTNSDGSIEAETLQDLTIPAYTSVLSGHATFTVGSTTVTSSALFTAGSTWEGWQIRIRDTNTWYTIDSVTNTSNLTITTQATANIDGYFDVGPIVGTTQVQTTTSGAATNIGAGLLTTLQSSVPGVASTTNLTAATGGADQETETEAVARTPIIFASRDVAISDEDYAVHAENILGGRAKARGGYNGTTVESGTTSVALLSPAWTSSSSVSSEERITVIRDLTGGRTLSGTTTIDLPANIQTFTSSPNLPAVLFYRDPNFDDATARVNVSEALNTYLSPDTYTWGRTIYTTDLVQIVEAVDGVDRVHSINGVAAIGMHYRTAANAISFTYSSTSATANAADIGADKITANRTFLIDTANNVAYLVVQISGTTLTLDRAYGGSTGNISDMPYMNSGDTALDNWYSLPYVELSIDSDDLEESVYSLGAAE